MKSKPKTDPRRRGTISKPVFEIKDLHDILGWSLLMADGPGLRKVSDDEDRRRVVKSVREIVRRWHIDMGYRNTEPPEAELRATRVAARWLGDFYDKIKDKLR